MYIQVFCPAFYVVYDHQEKAVVVAIRGSMTVQVGKNYVLFISICITILE